MNENRTQRKILAVLVAASVVVPLAVEARGEEALGRRYTDPVNGFSLRPPLDAERVRQTSPALLVSWRKRDPDRNAVLWTLSVLRAVEKRPMGDLGTYSKALADKLRGEQNYKVDSVALPKVAGLPGISFKGVTGGVGRFYQEQVWVLSHKGKVDPQAKPGDEAEPTEFLVLVINGPADMEKELSAVLSKVVGTLEVTDPRTARAEREAKLCRGQEFLASLTDEKLAAAAKGDAQWYLMRFEGKDVGFMRVAAAKARREGASGYELKNWVVLQLPKSERRLLKRVMFTTLDRNVERWAEQLKIGDGPAAETFGEDGIKQAEMIVCNISQGGRVRANKKPAPSAIYLPRAMGGLLPRLIDLGKAESYAFATYTSSANSFDMRTFTVVGPDRVEIDGKDTEAIRVTDRVAEDTEPATLWLDAKGDLLLMESPDGLTMRRSSRSEVRRLFVDADQLVNAMGK